MNASALKRFVDENQRLAVECSNLLAQCKRWEKECALYDHDREALMDFGNEADERAKEAEIRVHDLEEEVRKLSEELHFYKCQYETQVVCNSPPFFSLGSLPCLTLCLFNVMWFYELFIAFIRPTWMTSF